LSDAVSGRGLAESSAAVLDEVQVAVRRWGAYAVVLGVVVPPRVVVVFARVREPVLELVAAAVRVVVVRAARAWSLVHTLVRAA